MINARAAGAACLGLAAMLAIAGCNRSVSALDPRVPPEPLASAPLDPVQSGPIDPQTGLPIQQQPGQLPPPQPGQQTAALDPNSPPPAQPMPPPVGAEPISREGMAGTWTVASDNPECRIILAFTKWSGGYRAATRRCNTPELAAVTAWDVKGSQVVLVDANGSNVATLVSAGPEQYQGQTTGGKPIQFTR